MNRSRHGDGDLRHRGPQATRQDAAERAVTVRASRESRQRVVRHDAHLNGARLHWLEQGRGRPLLLLHGLGNNRLVWRKIAPQLATTNRLIMPDLPGFGWSEPLTGSPLLVEYVRSIAALCDRVAGEQPVAVVGHSTGGAVALRLALERPDRVRRLALIDPAGTGHGVPDWWRLAHVEPVVRLLSSPLLAVAPRSLVERIVGGAYRQMAFADPAAVSDRAVRLFASGLNTRERLARFLRSAHDLVASFETEVQALERPLPMPVLVVWGRQDRLVPLHDALALLERIGSAELRVIEGAGHLPHLEQPAAVAAALAGFLAPTPSDRRAARGGGSTRITVRRHRAGAPRPRRSGPRAAPPAQRSDPQP